MNAGAEMVGNTLCFIQGLNAYILLKQVTGFYKKWEDKAGVLLDMIYNCVQMNRFFFSSKICFKTF